MSNRAQGNVSYQRGPSYAAVGPTIDNGFEMGGSRMYPWSSGMAIQPTAYYSSYIGPGTGLPVSVPAGSLPDTSGSVPSSHAAVAEVAAHPFGRSSPLPWAVAGLAGGLFALWAVHYKGGE